MKRIIFICSLLFAFAATAGAQGFAVKSNAAGWATYGTVNFGAEWAFAPQWSVDVDLAYNPWEFSDHRQSKFWAVSPEFRFWFDEGFKGHFIGLHGQYSDYNFGMKKYRYTGWQSNLGLSYGYALPISDRWLVEANLGLGWIRRKYDQNDRHHYPGDVVMFGSKKEDLFGITRAGLSIVFLIK